MASTSSIYIQRDHTSSPGNNCDLSSSNPSLFESINTCGQAFHLALAKMPAFAELHNENTVDGPAFKSQKTEAINTLQVKLLSAAATLPKRGSAKAAGYDLAR